MITNFEICTPKLSELPQIVEIFNQAIQNKFSTGFQSLQTVESMNEWFREHTQEKYPLLIAKQDNTVLGWVEIKPYRKNRKAFDQSVEISYFIHNNFQKQGIGSALVREMEILAEGIGYKKIIAILMHLNIGSIKLLEGRNYTLCGNITNVGSVQNTSIHHLYYAKDLLSLQKTNE
ncbi:MAG: hypothetical protein A2X64_00325 [Ignavibacteria bacterium GWF2_33_9]|nr:MAG: hypothetical protein A2X64_00325 [Ignavibacteria bacterium GWF2_33_9]